MHAVCINNKGFEDTRTVGKSYPVLGTGHNSYYIEGDDGVERWVGEVNFELH